MKPARYLTVMVLVALACARKRETNDTVQATPAPPPASSPAPSTPAPTSAPQITSLSPDSVRLAPNRIAQVTIRGSGFLTAAGNTVRIGPIVLRQVPSTGGTTITVVVPERYTANTEAPPRPLADGSYPVTVEHSGRTSNAVQLKVLP